MSDPHNPHKDHTQHHEHGHEHDHTQHLTEKHVYHQTFMKLMEEIQVRLKAESIDITDEFVVMITKCVALDPVNKFLIKQQMVHTELDRLKKIVVDRILAMSSIARNTITMQLHFRMSYYNREDSIYAHREDQESKIQSLMDDIKTGIPKNLRVHDIWYAKLIGATIIEADMGPATESSVVRETEAALSSIFPKEDMDLLTSMTVRDREIELYHLMHITIGIRLYSKDKNPRGYGEFIEDLVHITPQKMEQTIEAMSHTRSINIRRLVRYTTLAQPYFLRRLIMRMDRRAVNSEMVKIRQALAMVHQILIYLKELTDDLHREMEVCHHYVDTFKGIMRDLHKTVEDKGSDGQEVPRTVLYPKFVELTGAWRDLQECQVFVNSIGMIAKSLTEFTSIDLEEMDIITKSLLEGLRVPTEHDFFKFPNVKLLEDKYALAKRIEFREDVDPLQMSCSGFCIHSLVSGVGLVLLSNPHLGIFNWKNQNYLMANVRAAMEFRRDPDSFVHKAHAIARRWPELILLLNVEKEAFNVGGITEADRSGKTTNVLISTDAEAQTELHPIESMKYESYTWNEWDLRRRGLILSKIHKCRTHGTQTHWQALKHNAEIQTYSTKGTYVQTNRNVYSEIPLSQFFLYGLRGLHCGVPPHVVEITQENPTDLKGKTTTKYEPPVELEDAIPFEPQINYM